MKTQFLNSILIATMVFSPVLAFGEGAKVPVAKESKRTFVSPSDAKISPVDDAKRDGKLMMRVMFMGALSQGMHYFPENSDLLTCIMYIGGYNENADLDGITIRRRGLKKLIEVDLEDLVEDGAPIPILKDGDIVTVDYSWRRDLQLYYTITGFLTSITGFTLAVVALTK